MAGVTEEANRIIRVRMDLITIKQVWRLITPNMIQLQPIGDFQGWGICERTISNISLSGRIKNRNQVII